MPSYVVKADPDLDLYVLWSSIVDGPCESGTREEMVEILFFHDDAKYRFPDAVRSEIQERLDRADKNGTSAMWPREGPDAEGGWEDDTFLVYSPPSPHWTGPSILPRENLRAWLESDLEDWSLLHRCEDSPE